MTFAPLHMQCDANTHSLLCSEFPIRHQVNLIGEVHGHSQLDEQINAEAVATLGDDWASCNKTSQEFRGQNSRLCQRMGFFSLCLFFGKETAAPSADTMQMTTRTTTLLPGITAHGPSMNHSLSHHLSLSGSLSLFLSLGMAHSATCIHI